MTRASGLVLIALVAACFHLSAAAARCETATLQQLTDERDVVRVIAELDAAMDGKNWDKAKGLLADELTVDFTSTPGGKSGPMKSDELVNMWKGGKRASLASTHIRGSHIVTVTGDKAVVASSALTVTKVGTGGLWQLAGRETHELKRTPAGWKISGIAFVTTAEHSTVRRIGRGGKPAEPSPAAAAPSASPSAH